MQEEERSPTTPEARRQAILEEERRAGAAQLAQARSSWEREAVETAARMRAADRWRAEGLEPKASQPSRSRQLNRKPPVSRF
jgi:hypothetical protein